MKLAQSFFFPLIVVCGESQDGVNTLKSVIVIHRV